MFARRTMVLGAFAIFGYSATVSAQAPAAAPTAPVAVAAPAALPITVVSESTPVRSTRNGRRFGLRRNRTTNTISTASYTVPSTTTPVVMTTQATVPTPKPMPMPATTTQPAGTTTTPAPIPATVVSTPEMVPTMTTVSTGTTGRVRPVRTGLFSRLFSRR